MHVLLWVARSGQIFALAYAAKLDVNMQVATSGRASCVVEEVFEQADATAGPRGGRTGMGAAPSLRASTGGSPHPRAGRGRHLSTRVHVMPNVMAYRSLTLQ